MKRTSSKKDASGKRAKTPIKGLMRATVLASTLLLSHSTVPASEVPASKKSIRDRVELVREALKQKVANNEGSLTRLSFAEKGLVQWGNWNNWNNWLNWNNWNNWRNWANWGNWRNI